MQDESKSPKLSEDRMEGVIQAIKKLGFCGSRRPDNKPSLLELDSATYKTREFANKTTDQDLWDPPEFCYYAYASLDAYVTAVLTVQLEIPPGRLHFTCSLTPSTDPKSMMLRFNTEIDDVPLNAPREATSLLLSNFRDGLSLHEVEVGPIFLEQLDGCVMKLSYPGQMIPESPFLRNRPHELWPQAYVKLEQSPELKQRVDNFVWLVNHHSIDGIDN